MAQYEEHHRRPGQLTKRCVNSKGNLQEAAANTKQAQALYRTLVHNTEQCLRIVVPSNSLLRGS
jgi:hypothetical protein